MTKQATNHSNQAKRKAILCRISIIFFLIVISTSLDSNAQGTWVPVTNTAPHTNEGVMLLLTNGTVLCKTSSGGTGYGTRWDKLTPDIHGSYINGTWTTIAAMASERLYFSTQVLPDGRVYVAGGEYGAGGNKGEVYNPLTNVWTACPQIVFTKNISDANSELLPNGKVLQAVVDTGGTKLNYFWDPATNTYAHAASCLRVDNEAVWVKLPDNSIVFVDNYGTTSERYIPATNTWINDGTVPTALYDPYDEEAGAGFMLPDGRAWFIGSKPTSAYYTPSGTTSPGTWAAGPAIPGGQGAPDAASAMMVNGQVLLAVSPTPAFASDFPDSTDFYVFDYTTNTFTRVGAPGITGDTIVEPSYVTNMLALPDGTILFANQGDNKYYEFVPTGAPLAAGKPTLDSIIRTSCDTFKATGKLFNGITEGAAYGDDWQMSTNYPIIRLASGTSVYYAATYNWNRLGAVMTGALEDTTTFVIPATVPVGTYSVTVVVNGNPSSPVMINTSQAITPSPAAVCIGSPTTLSDVWPGGTWSSGNTGVATIDPVSGIATGTGPGSTTITYTLGACTSTATATVVSPPAAIMPATPVVVCTSIATHLSDAVAGGTWSSSNTSVATVTAAGLVTSAAQGIAVISYATGCGTAATQTITVNGAPAAITGNTTICLGGGPTTTTLSDPATGGTWSSSNTVVATVDAAGNVVTNSSLGATTISYANGCGSAATQTVTVNGSPGSISGNNSVCFGGGTTTITLSEATTGGTWSSSNTSVATVNNSGTVTSVSQGTTTISYSGGCGTDATLPVTVNAVPAAIAGTNSICLSSATTAPLSEASTGGTWTSSNTTIATVDPVTGIVTGSQTGTSVITYANGCGTDATINFDVAAPPATPAPIAGSGALFCTGTTLALSDATPGGAWSSDNTAIAVAGTSGSIAGISGGPAVISYVISNACGNSAATTNVTVSPLPATQAITGYTTIFCAGTSIPLSDITPGGTWSSNTTTVATIDNNGILTGVAGGSSTVYYSVTNACGTVPVSIIVTIAPLPALDAITGTTTICAGSNTTLNDATAGGTWSSSAPGIAAIGSTGVVTGIAAGNVVISYAATNSCGTDAATVNMTINTLPASAGTITGVDYVCNGHIIYLSDNIAGGVWSSDFPSTAFVTTTGEILGTAAGTDTIRYTVTNACGSRTAVAAILVLPASSSLCWPTAVANVAGSGITELKVYPNPNTGTFTILVSSANDEPVTITITNVVGEKVKEFGATTNQNAEVQLNAAAGMYFITASTKDGKYNAKVAIKGQ